MSREQLNAAARHFLGRILPTATGKHFAELNNAEALLGAYRRYDGAAVTAFGRPITPEFVLKVKTGAVAVQGDNPALGTDPVPADAANHPLIWMRFGADAKVDDQATIQDLMGDLDTYAEKKFSLAGVDVNIPDDTPAPANSAAWAKAIQPNRAAIPDNLASLTEVPAPFKTVAPTLPAFRLILSHFFTFDETGAYYPRWSGAGRQIPQDLSEAYKRNNIREVKLQRDQLHVYMLVPKSLFTTPADAHDYREAVIRLDETGDPSNPFMPTLVHSAYRRIETASTFHDFIFFESEDGVGLPVPAAAQKKLAPSVIQFLLSVPTAEAERERFLRESPHVIFGNPPLVQLLATSEGQVQLPEGARFYAPEAGGFMFILSPIDKAMDIAALTSVRYLDLGGKPHLPSMNLARTAVEFDAFRTKFSDGKRDGSGAIVGIIDTGIDGRHPAFNDASGNSRILAVWEQDDGGHGNPNSPAAKHPGNAAYHLLNFGRERTGADVRAATDQIGHGTHVAGIAAGDEVSSPGANVPRGIASNANIIMVKAIGFQPGTPAAAQASPELGLQYIFQKAKELGKPCVVNMSFGHHNHAHDGTDIMSLALTNMLRDTAGNYLGGRVLVAAAGNERGKPIHVRRDLAASGSVIFRYFVNGFTGPVNQVDLVSMWVRPYTRGFPKPNLRVAIQHRATSWTSAAVTATTAHTPVVVPGQNITVFVTYGNQDPHNGDYNLQILFSRPSTAPPLPAEEWRIIVTNGSTSNVEIHGWSAFGFGAFLGLAATDDSVKVGTPAAARDVISVACSATRLNWPDVDTPATLRDFSETRLGDITSFSSPGPLRTCSERLIRQFFLTKDVTHPAIDIAAPGSAIQSALSAAVSTAPPTPTNPGHRPQMANNNSWFLQGTSMASPVIAGLVACILAENPNLNQEQIRNKVRAAGKLPAAAATTFNPGDPDENAWGPGLVNAPALKS